MSVPGQIQKSARPQFALYRYTYVRGFRELQHALLLEPHYKKPEVVTDYVRAARKLAVLSTPPEWRTAFVENFHWDACNEDSLVRICKGEPSRLDRSCHAMLALDITFKTAHIEALRNVDVYDYIRLAPAMYAIRDLSPEGKAFLSRKTHHGQDLSQYEKLVATLLPQDGQNAIRGRPEKARAFPDAAAGFALTRTNGRAVLSGQHRPYQAARTSHRPSPGWSAASHHVDDSRRGPARCSHGKAGTRCARGRRLHRTKPVHGSAPHTAGGRPIIQTAPPDFESVSIELLLDHRGKSK